MTHVLEHVPAPRRYPKGSKITEVYSILSPTTEDVHGVVDQRRRMALSSNRNVPNTFQFAPAVRPGIVSPYVVEPRYSVSSTE